jgi:NAD(P)-dependent dehydrogenase (short-subunit alcohol dehydrogenase family)
MAARGGGAVVNASTFGASVAGKSGGIYGASKAALELMTLVWADEFGPAGVRANAAAAGPTRTRPVPPPMVRCPRRWRWRSPWAGP